MGALGTFTSYEANVVQVPMDEHGLVPDALGAVWPGWPRPGGGPSSSTPARPSTTRAGSACPGRAVRRSSASASGRACRWSRTTRTGCSVSTGTWARLRADDPGHVPGHVFQDDRAGIAGRLGGGARRAARQAGAGRGIRRALPLQFRPALVREYLATQPWREQVKVFRELYRERRDTMLEWLWCTCRLAAGGPPPGGGLDWWLGLPGMDAKATPPRAPAAPADCRALASRRLRRRGSPRLTDRFPAAGPDPGRRAAAGLRDRRRARTAVHVRPVQFGSAQRATWAMCELALGGALVRRGGRVAALRRAGAGRAA